MTGTQHCIVHHDIMLKSYIFIRWIRMILINNYNKDISKSFDYTKCGSIHSPHRKYEFMCSISDWFTIHEWTTCSMAIDARKIVSTNQRRDPASCNVFRGIFSCIPVAKKFWIRIFSDTDYIRTYLIFSINLFVSLQNSAIR